MDTIGIGKSLYTLPSAIVPGNGGMPKSAVSHATVPEAPVLPQSGEQTQFDPVMAERKRYEAVRKQAQDVFVISDRRFTIFKDSSGQYITRFTSLRDGKVTYIPEPDLFSMQSRGAEASVVKIEA